LEEKIEKKFGWLLKRQIFQDEEKAMPPVTTEKRLNRTMEFPISGKKRV
jgi:hypothetical protein